MSTVLDAPREQRPYKRYGAADIMWKSRRREVLMAGPGDTGKSRACLEKLHHCADKYPGARILMVRKTRKSLTQSAMVTYEQKVLPEGWLGKRGKKGLIHFSTSDQQYEYPNGSIIAVAGMDNAEKVLSSEWDMIYPQEATELTENNWEILTMRLRNSVMPYQQLIADCNPSYPTHWLKLRCDRGATLMLNSRHEDNPSITSERIAVLDALTGVRKLRLRHGIWAAAEGMVYEEWDEVVHKVTLAQLVQWNILTRDGKINPAGVETVIAGMDWGWTNPGTLLVFALDHDGRLYLIHEVYQTQKTDDWWLERGKQLKQRYGIRQFICDPAMPAYIAKFKEAGLNAVEADNDIAAGVNDVRERLQLAGDGRPRFYMYEYCLSERDESRVDARQPFCLDGEILEYVWPKAQDGKPIKEVPVAVNNHACLVAGTMVATKYGDVPIEQIQEGDCVLTRWGYKRVKESAMTSQAAKVYTVHFSNGATLTGTDNHPVYVQGKGYTALRALRYGDIMETPEEYIERGSLLCHQGQSQLNQKSFTTMVSPIADTPTLSDGRTATTTLPTQPMWIRVLNADSISKSGRMLMDLFQRGTRSITRMATRSIMPSAIWNASQQINTVLTTRLCSLRPIANGLVITQKACDHWQLLGTNPIQVGNGTERWQVWHGRKHNSYRLSATTAVPNIRSTISFRGNPGFALMLAGQPPGASQELTILPQYANNANRNIHETSTVNSVSVHKNAQKCTVLSIEESEVLQSVYNLTIEKDAISEGEYFANGVLVHNCDALRYTCRLLSSQLHTSHRLMSELKQRQEAREKARQKMTEGIW